MKLIVGLGNPGKKYALTRHNFGFRLLDELADRLGFCFKHNARFQAEAASLSDPRHEKLFFLKPQTFMNQSGAAVAPFARFYKIAVKDILAVFDDVDLPLGKIRFARAGSAGGHNGIKSLIETLGTQDFPRLKLGIGRPAVVPKDTADHVLEKFTKDEEKAVKDVLSRAAQAVGVYLKEGIESAMNQYN